MTYLTGRGDFQATNDIQDSVCTCSYFLAKACVCHCRCRCHHHHHPPLSSWASASLSLLSFVQGQRYIQCYGWFFMYIFWCKLRLSLWAIIPLSHVRKSRFRELEFPKVTRWVESCAVTQARTLHCSILPLPKGALELDLEVLISFHCFSNSTQRLWSNSFPFVSQ